MSDLIKREDEVWKPIAGYEDYQISSYGRVKNKNEKLLKPFRKGKYGHSMVGLSKCGVSKKFQVHRLVANAFLENPHNKPEVCHIDNSLDEDGFLDNSVNNLLWGTHKENCEFGNTRKRQSENHANFKGENNPNYGKHLTQEAKDKMTKDRGKQVLQWDDGKVIAFYNSIKEAGRKTGISWTNIKNVCDGKYQHAGGYEWTYACKPYDVNKVEEQLDKLLGDNWRVSAELYDKIIEIVKKGGVE